MEYFGENYKKTRDELVSEGILQYKTGPRGESVYGYRYDDHPGSEISIRGLSSNRFQVMLSILKMRSLFSILVTTRESEFRRMNSCWQGITKL